MSDFKSFLAGQVRAPEFRRKYDALEPEFALAQALIDVRKQSGLAEGPWSTEAAGKFPPFLSPMAVEMS